MAEPRHDLPIPLPVELARPDGAKTLEYAVNLSARGLCLQLREPLVVGDCVEVVFQLPPAGPTVQARAEVVWSGAAEPGESGPRLCETGLRLEGLDAELQDQLAAYAEQLGERRR